MADQIRRAASCEGVECLIWHEYATAPQRTTTHTAGTCGHVSITRAGRMRASCAARVRIGSQVGMRSQAPRKRAAAKDRPGEKEAMRAAHTR